MSCPDPRDATKTVPTGTTACHNSMLFVCTVQGWRNTGAPCHGEYIGTTEVHPETLNT